MNIEIESQEEKEIFDNLGNSVTKIRITKMPCFEEVAKVIGRVKAQQELFIAVSSKDTIEVPYYLYDKNYTHLINSFDWNSTPQGRNFWSLINEGINPYG